MNWYTLGIGNELVIAGNVHFANSTVHHVGYIHCHNQGLNFSPNDHTGHEIMICKFRTKAWSSVLKPSTVRLKTMLKFKNTFLTKIKQYWKCNFILLHVIPDMLISFFSSFRNSKWLKKHLILFFLRFDFNQNLDQSYQLHFNK